VTRVDGLLNIEDFADESGLELPEGPYETVAGFVMAKLGRVPLLGDTVVEGGHQFEVVAVDGRRVSRVSVMRVARPSSVGDEGSSEPEGNATQ
jgi:putative hemolysin